MANIYLEKIAQDQLSPRREALNTTIKAKIAEIPGQIVGGGIGGTIGAKLGKRFGSPGKLGGIGAFLGSEVAALGGSYASILRDTINRRKGETNV